LSVAQNWRRPRGASSTVVGERDRRVIQRTGGQTQKRIAKAHLRADRRSFFPGRPAAKCPLARVAGQGMREMLAATQTLFNATSCDDQFYCLRLSDGKVVDIGPQNLGTANCEGI